MIVTLTANPSMDRTVSLSQPLERGAVLRARSTVTDPGGKGVNVARVLAAAGVPVVAVLPGNAGDPLLTALTDRGIEYRSVPTSGNARSNITISEPDGTTTKLNEPGTEYAPQTLVGLHRAVVQLAASAQWVVLSGSLPPGVPAVWYAELVRTLRGLPCKIAVDTSEAPLLALAEQFPEAAPDLIKPNSDELAQLTGFAADKLESAAAQGDPSVVARAGRALVERGVGAVLATLGAAGAVLVTADGAWWAAAPEVTARSTVGAGDSSLAGYLLADRSGRGPADRLRHAVAHGSAAVTLPGTALPTPDQVRPDSVTVTALDTSRTESSPLLPAAEPLG